MMHKKVIKLLGADYTIINSNDTYNGSSDK